MERGFIHRLGQLIHVAVAATYLLGTAVSLGLVTFGLGSAIYGAANYGTGYLTSEKELPLVVPPDHAQALLEHDPAAIEREARLRLEGNKKTNYSLPLSDRLRLEEKVDAAIWDITDTPEMRERKLRSTSYQLLRDGVVAALTGLALYLVVWTLRWLVTGRSSSVLTGLKLRARTAKQRTV